MADKHTHRWGLHRNGQPIHQAENPTGPISRICWDCKKTDDSFGCEAEARDSGGWPRWHQCHNKASTTSPYGPDLVGGLNANRLDGTVHHYCKAHHPETVALRSQAQHLASQTKYDLERRKLALGYEAPRTSKFLDELMDWAEMNRDLAEADEWLGTILAQAKERQRVYS